MATQIQPEPINPDPQDPSSVGDQNTQDSTPDQTPPTNPQPDSPTDDAQSRYVKLLEETLREQAQQIQAQGRQIQEVHDRVTAPPAPEPVDPEELRRRFYENPREETRQVVSELLNETVGPLRQFVEEIRGQNVVQREIANVKADARFSQHWDDRVEAAVTAAINSVPPAQVNSQFVVAATIQAIGMKAAGLLGGNPASSPNPNPNPNPSNNQPTVTNPPHMRPSAPTPPRNNPNNNQKPVLTELERRLARERGQTDEEYVKWRDMPASDVAFTDLGKPPKK